jgi:hypothetical protein
MKLSPQRAGVLMPLPSRADPASLFGKDAFAATMRDLVVPPSGPAVTAVLQSPTAGLPQFAGQKKPVSSRQEMHASGGEEHLGTNNLVAQTPIVVTDYAVPPVPRDAVRHPVIPQPSGQVSTPTEESSELPISMSEGTDSIEETILPRPLRAPREPRLAADTDAPSSRAEHKASAVTRDSTSPAIAHSPETLPAATTPPQWPIAVSVPQPDKPEQTFLESNVQPASHRLDRASGDRRRASISQPVMTARTAASNRRNEILQQPQEEQPLKEAATALNSQKDGPVGERASSGTLPTPNQNIRFGPAAPSKEDRGTTALQVDAHASEEVGKTSSAVSKPVVAAEPAIHPILDLSPAQHPTSANTGDPSPAMHRPEALTETHRAQENTAQVLQRMDTAASSGAEQLRADARHLDVGVSSSVLGWVEVRATASSSGRVDAALHVQTNSSAHMLTAQSKEIATYAREHSVELGQLSVGVGTGDSARDQSRSSMHEGVGKDDIAPVRRAMKSLASNEPQQLAEKVSFISVRA